MGTRKFAELLSSFMNDDTKLYVQVGFNRFPITNVHIDAETNALIFNVPEDADNPPIEMPDMPDIA